MSPRVTLRVLRGSLSADSFPFEDRTTCILGRAVDCLPRIPEQEENRTVSRHHCLLDINPPGIRVRDFGSRNGTFVNEKVIGHRKSGQTPEEGARETFTEVDLRHGDVLRLGAASFRVEIHEPAVCVACGRELAENDAATGRHCPECLALLAASAGAEAPAPVSEGGVRVEGVPASGARVPPAPRSDPLEALRQLLASAQGPVPELKPLKGLTWVRELGRGGMGLVGLARVEATGEAVAVKVMLPKIAFNSRSRHLFEREVALTRQLHHKNIVTYRDGGCSDGVFYLALEYCDGGSVEQLVRQAGGRLPLDEALEITRQILDGLDYAHGAELAGTSPEGSAPVTVRGLVHRDLKPPNVLVSGTARDRTVKISDFGLSKAFDLAGLSGFTRTGVMSGTPVFMPRQQVVSFKYAKPEVDVWAAAACLYNMLTGRFPRDFPAGQDPWRVVLDTPARPIGQRVPGIPKKLAGVIDAALVDRPTITFTSARELRQALDGAL